MRFAARVDQGELAVPDDLPEHSIKKPHAARLIASAQERQPLARRAHIALPVPVIPAHAGIQLP